MRTPIPLLLALALPFVGAPLAGQEGLFEPGFAQLRRPMPGSPWTRALGLGDWDGDGDVDALVSVYPPTFFDSELRLLSNDGEGRLELAQTFLYAPPVVSAATGDLDGDGDLDAFLGGAYGLLVLLNDGAGGGTVTTPATSYDQYSRFVALADFDGDGALDGLAAGNAGVFVFAGAGDGTFASEPAFYGEAGFVNELTVADLDGDDDLDVAVAGNGLALLSNDGTGAFDVVVEPSLFSLYSLQSGDVDADGDVDLVYVDSQLRLLLNDGSAGFTDATVQLPGDPTYADIVLLRDFDGDDDLDLALGSSFLRNDGSGTFSVAPGVESLPPLFGSWFVDAADLDGDDDLDIVATGPDLVLYGDGTGAFLEPIEDDRQGSIQLYGPMALGDVDGDGDIDAVAPGQGWELLLNDGRGVFAVAEGAIPVGINYGRPTLADVDGDGDLDLFVGGVQGLALNDGLGHFTLAPGCTPGANQYILDSVLADFDGDGDLDAFLGRAVPRGPSYEGVGYNPAPDALWENDGGCFVDVTADRLPALAGAAFGVAAGDVDGDGDLDAITSTGQLYRNDGTGDFTEAQQMADVQGTDIALGDLDGDGDLDVYVASRLGDVILWNDGTGTFPDPPTLQPTGGRNVALTDLEGDGDLDVVLGVWRPTGGFGSFVTYMELWRNDGTGSFSLSAYPWTTEIEFALADLDGDQDVDVLHPHHTFMNLTRSLSRESLARPGRPLSLELHGRPGAYWKLFATTSLLDEPFVTPRGAIRLDPTTLLLRRHGAFGPSGARTVHVPVPANPALIGTTVYWQALIGAPPRWSAFEQTTFTAF